MTRNSPILLMLLVTSCGGENLTASLPAESVLFAQVTETIRSTAVAFYMMPVPGDVDSGVKPVLNGQSNRHDQNFKQHSPGRRCAHYRPH